MSCYASILCDSAELRAHLGEKEHASELLSSALKALDACAAADAHGIGTGNATAAAPVADVEQVVSRDSRQLALQPILGRVLGAMAQLHAEEAQAVTAEGLFRAALEKLTGPYAIHDPRYVHSLHTTDAGAVTLCTGPVKQNCCNCDNKFKSIDSVFFRFNGYISIHISIVISCDCFMQAHLRKGGCAGQIRGSAAAVGQARGVRCRFDRRRAHRLLLCLACISQQVEVVGIHSLPTMILQYYDPKSRRE